MKITKENRELERRFEELKMKGGKNDDQIDKLKREIEAREDTIREKKELIQQLKDAIK